MKISSVVARDLVQWATGLGLSTWEVLGHEEPRLTVLGFALVLMGIPAATGLFQLRQGDTPANPTGTPEPRSQSQQPSS